jgi:hypothetical protein
LRARPQAQNQVDSEKRWTPLDTDRKDLNNKANNAVSITTDSVRASLKHPSRMKILLTAWSRKSGRKKKGAFSVENAPA